MKWYYIFLVVVIVLSTLTVYKALTPQNYDSNGISFNYPGSWVQLSLNNSDEVNGTAKYNVVAIGDPNSDQNILVIVQKTKKSGTLEDIVAASKADLKKDWNATMLSDDIINVDGRQAHDVVYVTDPKTNKKERMVIFDKNNMIYCIILGSSTFAFDGQKNNFDMIVKSFRVTDW